MTTKKLLKIAKVYGIKELIQVKSGDKLCQANGEDSYLNHSYLIGDDRIELGIYEDKELKIASFFHEIGHLHTSGGPINEPYEVEKRAWEIGFEIAKINGYTFKPTTHKWAKEQMLSYKSPEIKKQYGVLLLKKSITVEVYRKQTDLDLTFTDSTVEAIPIFDTKD